VGATRFIEMTKNIIVSSSLTINGPPPPRIPTATAAVATIILCMRRRRRWWQWRWWFMCCSQRTLKPVCAIIYTHNNIHLYYNLIALYIDKNYSRLNDNLRRTLPLTVTVIITVASTRIFESCVTATAAAVSAADPYPLRIARACAYLYVHMHVEELCAWHLKFKFVRKNSVLHKRVRGAAAAIWPIQIQCSTWC
jgi:hypothetical protein